MWYSYALLKLSEWTANQELWATNNGDILFADGDIGDYNHEAHVLEQILAEHDKDDLNPHQYSQEELINMGFSSQEAKILLGKSDAREYAVRNWGWVRINGTNAEGLELNSSTLRNISNTLYEAYGDHVYNLYFDLYFDKDQSFYNDVPFTEIEKEDPDIIKKYINGS